jgi:rhamnogalacturonan endolyase
MHPSDSRIASWDVGNYIVGTTATSSFPSYMWQDINNGHVIYFKLTASQLTAAHTIRIGITEAYIGGRPQITVNSWKSSIPGATTQASTRSLTVGTYRGNNHVLEYTVPATAWLDSTTSWQVLTINIVTGSTGTKYLSGGIAIDCVEMI